MYSLVGEVFASSLEASTAFEKLSVDEYTSITANLAQLVSHLRKRSPQREEKKRMRRISGSQSTPQLPSPRMHSTPRVESLNIQQASLCNRQQKFMSLYSSTNKLHFRASEEPVTPTLCFEISSYGPLQICETRDDGCEKGGYPGNPSTRHRLHASTGSSWFHTGGGVLLSDSKDTYSKEIFCGFGLDRNLLHLTRAVKSFL